MEYNNGRLYRISILDGHKEEIMYFHMQKRSMEINKTELDIKHYYMVRNKLVPDTSNVYDIVNNESGVVLSR